MAERHRREREQDRKRLEQWRAATNIPSRPQEWAEADPEEDGLFDLRHA